MNVSLRRWSDLACMATLWLGIAAAPTRAAEGPTEQMAWATEHLNAGRYKEAVELLRKALAASAEGTPERAQATGRLADALRTCGEYTEALQRCDEHLKSEPQNKKIACLRAELLSTLGRYDEALKAFDALIETDGTYYRAWALRKRVYASLGDRAKIKKTCDLFFDQFQKNADYYHSDKVTDPLELAYIGLGIQDEMPKDAFEVGFMLAESLVEKRGLREVEAHLWAAELAFEKYHFGDAHKRYDTILKKIRPKHPDALAGMAQVLITYRHDVKNADPLLKMALEINPRHVVALVTRAVIDFTEDRFEQAKKNIDEALAVNPHYVEALAGLAFYYHFLNQPEKEAEVEKRVLAINPKNAEYYCLVGELIEDKHGYEDAPAYYRKAIDLDPEHWHGYYGLGMNTSRQGAHGEEEGKRLLLKAFEMNKFNVWASNMIRVLDKILGDRDQDVPAVYATSKTAHFTLKYHTKEEAIIRPYLEEWAEDAYAWQTAKFGFEPQGPLSIEVCFSTGDNESRTVGVPVGGLLGVCFGKLCTVVSPREGRKNLPPFNWRRVIEHEFGHVMALQMSKYRVPLWFTEAFSTFLENDSRINTDMLMVHTIAKNQLKPIEKMSEYISENRIMAYIHGRFVIEYINQTNGFDALKKALRMFAEGKKLEEVLPEVSGKSFPDLNTGVNEYVANFYKNVRLRPGYDPQDLARLEGAASSRDASAQAIADLAVAHLSTRQLQRAEAGALKALEKDPKCVDAINVLGAIAYEKKDFNAAKTRFEESTKLDPQRSFSAWHSLGLMYKKEGRTTKAIEALEMARRMYPRYAGKDNPHYLLPDLYTDLEPPQNDKALAVWLDAIKVNTDDAEGALKGLKMAMELKDWKTAAACAMGHIEINPYEPEVHRLAGRVYEELKDLVRAAREYRVATAIDEKDVESWVKLARIEIARRNRDEALRAVNAALDTDGSHEGAKELKKLLDAQ